MKPGEPRAPPHRHRPGTLLAGRHRCSEGDLISTELRPQRLQELEVSVMGGPWGDFGNIQFHWVIF